MVFMDFHNGHVNLHNSHVNLRTGHVDFGLVVKPLPILLEIWTRRQLGLLGQSCSSDTPP
jgi:hypothetical protein